jgi:hypothetical protein
MKSCIFCVSISLLFLTLHTVESHFHLVSFGFCPQHRLFCNISCGRNLLVQHYFGFCMSDKSTLFSHLQDIFTKHTVIGYQFFFLALQKRSVSFILHVWFSFYYLPCLFCLYLILWLLLQLLFKTIFKTFEYDIH